MNILVIGPLYEEGFAVHIAATLRSMGHTVVGFEPGATSKRLPGLIGHRIDMFRNMLHATASGVPALRARQMRGLWKIADPSVDVSIVCHDFLWPSEVAELKRRTGGPVAMWFPDALVNFHRGFFMNATYDALFFKDPFIVERLSTVLRSPVLYLPECFNPIVHRADADLDDSAYACDITTAGNPHTYRVAVMSHLAEWDVKLWGAPCPAWLDAGPVARMHQGRYVFASEKAQAFRAAKIVLNSLHYGEVWGVNVRAFEAAGVGAFQIIDWRPGLAQLFRDGEELVSFRGVDGMLATIRHWLPREEERRAIALAGQRRALREHTYEHRLTTLLACLRGDGRGFELPSIHGC